MKPYVLDPRLAADTLAAGNTTLCEVRLMNDARFPWAILVPRQTGLRDLHDLPGDRLPALMAEIAGLSAAMLAQWRGEKMNVAALGNLVPQLHIHVIVRYAADPAWPGPVWGVGTPRPYAPDAAREALDQLAACVASLLSI